ncbi:hypothetical protein SARC_06450 [Sphaeroforma arctica JP610]|uniref:Uncharacterized protein n=1 Tax=Sphaeroforma arctica JP610 TaxID=667725 RepID=A0A0L0FWM6_9EUKA|nr:hypothetical protein SARC_06450 [Sphaeroforma arctica JP610]KNC81222.1 hypothetical protein SARC_06450 [Sphaeroforma arctica JP610]|eukprot:XP_014155124.1 hypothetical protein SARC_06450 [Sphaeroforma arctica JP610]
MCISEQSQLDENGSVGEKASKVSFMTTATDIWNAFGWSHVTNRNIPSNNPRESDKHIKDTDNTGWSCMSKSLVSGAVRLSEFLYPANPNLLLKEAARSITGPVGKQNNSNTEVTQESNHSKINSQIANKVIEVYNVAPKGSVQKRKSSYCCGYYDQNTKGNESRRTFQLSGTRLDQSFRDMRQMMTGEPLIQPVYSRSGSMMQRLIEQYPLYCQMK